MVGQEIEMIETITIMTAACSCLSQKTELALAVKARGGSLAEVLSKRRQVVQASTCFHVQ
jgi:hypothetical protein